MHKILKIVLAVLGVAGMAFLARIVSTGDEDVKAAAAAADTSLIEPMFWIAYFVLIVIVALVVVFVIVNLFSSGATLKKTLISVGSFLVVAVLAYVLAEGVETPMQDGKMLSESGAKWVETGLFTFYGLAILSVLTLLGTGIKKMIS